MNAIALLDLVSTIGFITAFIFALTLRHTLLDNVSRIFLCMFLAIYVFVGFSNILEHSGATDYLDRYEDYAEILFIPLFIFFLYSITSRQELSRRKSSEEALMQSEQRNRTLLQAIPDLMFRISSKGVFLDYKEGKDLPLFTPPSRFIGATLHEVLPEDVAAVSQSNLDKALTTGEIQIFDYPLRVNGMLRHFEARFVQSGDDEVLAIVRDITEHRRLEEQLRHAQKMEAIGTLTGGVAHEFNNILTAIIGYGELLDDRIGRDNPLRPYIDAINTSAERAVKLTKGLLAYSRKQVAQMEFIDLADVLRDIEVLLSNLIGEHISLKMELPSEKLGVMADKAQLEQVLMNLVTNALDAMPQGGTLTIQSHYEELTDCLRTRQANISPGTYACISVGDTGTGIDTSTQERIFEPFFTTKDVDKGTGLGLSLSYGIIAKHKGHITVESEPGRGSLFRIYLPLCIQGHAAQPGEPSRQHFSASETTRPPDDAGGAEDRAGTV